MGRHLFLLLALVALVPVPSGSRGGERPWDQPFAQDTKTILAQAQAVQVPEGHGVAVLLEEHDYRIDKTGKTVSTVRKVFRILKPDAVEMWGALEQEYAPWYENRPEFRARVIRADGTVHWLDPKTIADSPAQEFDDSIFSDRRVLRAPLPAVAPGAVVEQQVIIRESAPLLDAGVVRRVAVMDFVPVQRFRLSAEAAKGLPLMMASRNLPAGAVREEERNGQKRIEVEMGPLEPRKEWIANLPFDEAPNPQISFTNGKSWNEVASRYAQIVDRQIAGADLQGFLAGVERSGGALEIATRLTAKLHQEIRYTGVEFGEAAIVPRTPVEVLQRKYGDCKDKAALLVAMLRMAGLQADVALLNAGLDTDVDAELPGLGLFNHAIVYVEAEKPIWIDATSPETRVGSLPLMDQNRLALVAHPGARALVRTPGSQASENRRQHNIEVRMSEFGPGEFVERVTASGYLETELRQNYEASDEKAMRERFEQFAKQNFQAKSVAEFSVTRKDDFSTAFQTMVHAQQARATNTAQDDAAVALHPYLVFEEVPYPLREELENLGEAREPRQRDFIFHGPHQIEYRYTIHPPRSFRPRLLPASEVLSLGTARYERSFQARADGTVEAVFRFDSGKQRLTPAEFEATYEALRERVKREPEVLTFVSEAAEHLAVGELGKAVKLVRENAAKDPKNPAAQVRLARMLVTAGATESAIETSRKITEAAPEFSHGWQALGWAFQHDSFGRRFKGNWNRAEAERAYRQALKTDPEDFIAQVDLAILLEHNASGQRYGKGAQLEEAITLYRATLKFWPDAAIRHNLTLALLHAGRYPETREEIRKLPRGGTPAALSLVVTALTEGPARAIIESQTTAEDNRARAQQLFSAGQVLIQMQQHAVAAELMKVGGRLVNMPQIGQADQYMRKEGETYPASDPRHAALQFLQQLLAREPQRELLRGLYASRARPGEKEESWASLRRDMRKRSRGMLPAGFEDILQFSAGVMVMKKTGEDGRGYRVEGEGMGDVPPLYMIREEEQYRVLGHKGRLQAVGELVLELLEQKDVTGAQWWLDTIVADLRPDNAYGAGSLAARLLWSGITVETRGPDAIRAAAASLIGRDTGSPKAIAMLRTARAAVTVDLQRAQIDLALCESLERAQQWKELMATGRRLAAHPLFQQDGFRFIVAAAEGLGEWATLKMEARQRLKDKNNAYALRAMTRATIATGDRQGAVEYFRQLSASFLATGEDRVAETWNLMLLGKGDQELLDRLTGDKYPLSRAEADYWYTIGMLQAHVGHADEALRSLGEALERDEQIEPDARAWALSGKIHEAHGLAEAAAAAYARMRASAQDSETAQNAVAFVQSKGTPTE